MLKYVLQTISGLLVQAKIGFAKHTVVRMDPGRAKHNSQGLSGCSTGNHYAVSVQSAGHFDARFPQRATHSPEPLQTLRQKNLQRE